MKEYSDLILPVVKESGRKHGVELDVKVDDKSECLEIVRVQNGSIVAGFRVARHTLSDDRWKAAVHGSVDHLATLSIPHEPLLNAMSKTA